MQIMKLKLRSCHKTQLMQVSGILLKTFFAYPESISLEELVASKGERRRFRCSQIIMRTCLSKLVLLLSVRIKCCSIGPSMAVTLAIVNSDRHTATHWYQLKCPHPKLYQNFMYFYFCQGGHSLLLVLVNLLSAIRSIKKVITPVCFNLLQRKFSIYTASCSMIFMGLSRKLQRRETFLKSCCKSLRL